LRVLEKYATGCGGGFNHRMGLFDRILIKDNHIAANGVTSPNELSIMLAAIKRNKRSNNLLIEVEIDHIEQLEIAIQVGVDAILLDNFSPSEVKKAVSINQNRVVLEASGGISLNSLQEYAHAKPHFISTGTPIHGSRWLDIGLDWS
jgi:nicotinate-nucleotide pyrophosphorylase (carboxylating)